MQFSCSQTHVHTQVHAYTHRHTRIHTLLPAQPGNVLLKSSLTDSRRFTTKLADFGKWRGALGVGCVHERMLFMWVLIPSEFMCVAMVVRWCCVCVLAGMWTWCRVMVQGGRVVVCIQ